MPVMSAMVLSMVAPMTFVVAVSTVSGACLQTKRGSTNQQSAC